MQLRDITEGMLVQHYKGGLYQVEHISADTEHTGRMLVTYRALTDDKLWTRPLRSQDKLSYAEKAFCEEIDDAGVVRPRFTRVDDCAPHVVTLDETSELVLKVYKETLVAIHKRLSISADGLVTTNIQIMERTVAMTVELGRLILGNGATYKDPIMLDSDKYASLGIPAFFGTDTVVFKAEGVVIVVHKDQFEAVMIDLVPHLSAPIYFDKVLVGTKIWGPGRMGSADNVPIIPFWEKQIVIETTEGCIMTDAKKVTSIILKDTKTEMTPKPKMPAVNVKPARSEPKAESDVQEL